MKLRLVKINDDFCLLKESEIQIGDVVFSSNWEIISVTDESFINEIKSKPKGFRKIIASTAGIGVKLDKTSIEKLMEDYYFKKLGLLSYDKFKNEYNFDPKDRKKRQFHEAEVIEFSFTDEYNNIKRQNIGLNVEVDENFNVLNLI